MHQLTFRDHRGNTVNRQQIYVILFANGKPIEIRPRERRQYPIRGWPITPALLVLSGAEGSRVEGFRLSRCGPFESFPGAIQGFTKAVSIDGFEEVIQRFYFKCAHGVLIERRHKEPPAGCARGARTGRWTGRPFPASANPGKPRSGCVCSINRMVSCAALGFPDNIDVFK